ncbi:MAG: hypothetical protein QXT77_08280 [Candidatus Methanomethylicaceae archaeon]
MLRYPVLFNYGEAIFAPSANGPSAVKVALPFPLLLLPNVGERELRCFSGRWWLGFKI